MTTALLFRRVCRGDPTGYQAESGLAQTERASNRHALGHRDDVVIVESFAGL